ncbi:polyprenol monophosphomannose synthase [Rhodohalobacter sp.]|uniref:polyprenol monophosphomannose synthase n=1 Tax=Rhodohalobacter sp. TaxID=1974210 RepID=UPI002ACE082B|nr:polyprenol monophosphomannose synthase [Rhodohalobacter sp.]MDZ7755453.1 polyprenol monophosphomannose synthase [Rhodohalobacter sp.]
MKSNTIVIIPTYNESHNVSRLIEVVMKLEPEIDILFVDDGSPDGTADLIKGKIKQYPERIKIIEREGKQGLGTAYVRGFEYAMEHGYDYVCEMDADFSHDPNDLPRLVEVVKSGKADLAIGSRYSNGISIVNWPLRRLILSYCANLYARIITGIPVKDTTAGFKCIHHKVLETIDLKKIRSNGYAFQIEIHFRAWKAGFKLSEVSIIFKEREEGVSKMSKSIVREAIWRVWSLKLRSILGKL